MSAMSKLEAVNEMLLAIGQAPVNTLAVAGIRDVSIASSMLDAVSREVQTDGHSFNTFIETVTPNVSGQIAVAADVINIDATDPRMEVTPWVDPQDSARKLFDVGNQRSTFEDPLEVSVIKLLPFESLPQHARRYILSMAKLRFQASTVGSPQLNNLFEQEVGLAYASFRKIELLQQDNNLLTAGGTIISRNRHRLRRYR